MMNSECDMCPKCGNSMEMGFAIKPHVESGHLYFAPQPLINQKTIELVSVFKCIKCGHSITNRRSEDELTSILFNSIRIRRNKRKKWE